MTPRETTILNQVATQLCPKLWDAVNSNTPSSHLVTQRLFDELFRLKPGMGRKIDCINLLTTFLDYAPHYGLCHVIELAIAVKNWDFFLTFFKKCRENEVLEMNILHAYFEKELSLALLCAVKANTPKSNEAAIALLTMGANPNFRFSSDDYRLHYSKQDVNAHAIMSAVVEAERNPQATALHYAINNGDENRMRALLRHKANPWVLAWDSYSFASLAAYKKVVADLKQEDHPKIKLVTPEEIQAHRHNDAKIKVFQKIYKALYKGESRIFKQDYLSNIYDVPSERFIEYLERCVLKNPNGRAAKAWELAILPQNLNNCFADNKALFKEIYKWSFNNSALLSRSTLLGVTFFTSASLNKAIDGLTDEQFKRHLHENNNRTSDICYALGFRK